MRTLDEIIADGYGATLGQVAAGEKEGSVVRKINGYWMFVGWDFVSEPSK